MTTSRHHSRHTLFLAFYLVCILTFLSGVSLSYSKSGPESNTAGHDPFQETMHWSADRRDKTSEACRDCHQPEYEDWHRSHHAWANRTLDPERDAVAFHDRHGTDPAGQSTRFYREGDTFRMEVTGPGDEKQTYTPHMVLGHTPLRQVLVPIGNGRWQATGLAWDPDAGEWFPVNEDPRTPGDWGHWTGRGMNWNSQCAWCHMTDYDKGYDLLQDTYATRWVEQGVSCIQCHGSMDGHAENVGKSTPYSHTPVLSTQQILDNCASCHSRREALTGTFRPGDDFHDHFRLQLPNDPSLYYADGQVRDEVYVTGSFLQSKMHAAGVRCADCHDPHSQELLLPVENNALCMSCHGAPGRLDAPVIQPVQHSRHDATSVGNRCVECHMPEIVTMQRDPRRDHGFHSPDPRLSIELGIPNACNRCHTDQSAEWSLQYVEDWFGRSDTTREQERTRAIHAAQQGDQGAARRILELIPGEPIPIWRATLLDLLQADARLPEVQASAAAALEDSSPLVRAAAVRVLGPLPEYRDRLRDRLENDPARVVRLTAAPLFAETLQPDSAPYRDYSRYLDFHADQPGGAANRAQFLYNRNKPDDALDWMERAIQYDPGSAPLYRDKALMHLAIGDKTAAVAALNEAIRIDPDSPQLHFELGLLLAEDAMWEQAAEHLENATHLDSGFHRAHYNLGLAYARRNRWLSALRAMQTAIAIQPDNPDYRYALSTIYVNIGDIDQALALANSILEDYPDYAPAARLIRDLRTSP